jgi:hypothetical protein
MGLSALIKRTEARLAAETDPKTHAEIALDLATYAKTRADCDDDDSDPEDDDEDEKKSKKTSKKRTIHIEDTESEEATTAAPAPAASRDPNAAIRLGPSPIESRDALIASAPIELRELLATMPLDVLAKTVAGLKAKGGAK